MSPNSARYYVDDLLPKEAIIGRFSRPVVFDDFGAEQLNEIFLRKPASMFELGLTVWTHHLEIDREMDPYALAQFVDRDDPRLIHHIADLIGQPVLHDIQYSVGHVQDSQLSDTVAAEILAAFVYPNYLHISDIQFSNPYEPISEGRRRYQFKRFTGLNLFGELLDKTLAVGRDIGATHLSLTAAGADLLPFFQRFGFEVENNAAGSAGVANGTSTPMRRAL